MLQMPVPALQVLLIIIIPGGRYCLPTCHHYRLIHYHCTSSQLVEYTYLGISRCRVLGVSLLNHRSTRHSITFLRPHVLFLLVASSWG